jgi:small-conductance mechanosensitive channel
MRDLDGAVRHLDGIFMVLVLLIWILILAAMITTRLTAFVTSAGTFVLGLSWLIGTTLQEIILSCIFLFVKHPYDVGDRVNVSPIIE